MEKIVKIVSAAAEKAHRPCQRRFDSWVSAEYKITYAEYCTASGTSKRQKRRLCSRLLRRDRRRWLNGLCNAASNAFEENRTADMFSILNEIQGTKLKKIQPPIRGSDDNFIYESSAISNELANHVE
jgi:hypothetical protein